MRILRWRARKAAGGMQDAPAPSWMRPLPTGPVVFDPSLRRAGELAGHVPVATALETRRPAVRAAAPEPPVHPHGHAA